MLMNTLKRLLVFVAKLTLGELLILTALLATISLTLLNAKAVEGWLERGEAYQNFPALVSSMMKSEDGRSVDQTAVSQAVAKAADPKTLEGLTKQLIDGTYNWLGGRVDKPDFSIDLTTVKANLIDRLGDEAVKRVAALPACPVSADFDALSSDCAPPGLSGEQVKDDVVRSLEESDQLLPQTTIKADQLKAGGQPVYLKFAAARQWFGLAKMLPFIAATLVIVDCLLILLFSGRLFNGFKSLWRFFLLAAVLLGLIGGAMLLACNRLSGGVASIGGNGGTAEDFALPIIRAMVASIALLLLLFAGSYLAFSLICLLGSILHKKSHDKKAEHQSMEYAHVDHTQPPTVQPGSEEAEPPAPPSRPTIVSG